MQNNKDNQYDAIIIGSGLGGLTAAGILSKLNKKKVLILEKHYELGGFTHEFKRGSYSWDVGLHYVGNMTKRFLDFVGLSLFKYLTNGRLQWNKMSNPFEKFFLPNLTIEIRESLKEYKKELIEKFPKQKKSIKKYIGHIHKVRLWCLAYFFSKFLHPPLAQIFNFLSFINKKKALITTEDYLNKYIKDKQLRSVLAVRWGNYGLPPMESAFAIHSLVEHHYYPGGVFPDGGAEKIATYFEETIEASGGKTLINREVTKILLDGKKAIGVKVINLADSDKKTEKYYAPIIISNAGAQITYNKLLPKSFNLPIQKKLSNFHPGYSGLDLYIGLKDSPETIGIKGENCWIIDSYDLNCFNKDYKDILKGNISYCFISFPSQKSGRPGGYTADIVTIFPYSAFKKWEGTYWKERPSEYYELKEKLTEGLLRLVDKYIPGFRNLVVYKEMATPLTFEHFSNRIRGTFYGLPSTPEKFMLKEIKVTTPIKGLYLTGTDILSNGITAALFSGMATASYLDGPIGIIKIIMKSIFYRPDIAQTQDTPILSPSDNHQSKDKMTGTLIEKKETVENMIELTYRFEKLHNFIPGQHVKLLVGEAEWRAYSIARADNQHLTLIIDTRTDGIGVNYAKKINPNQSSLFRMPLTDLTYHKTNRDLIFIASGTGLVPFLHILDELKRSNIKHKVITLFGTLKDEKNYINDYLKPYENYFSIEKHICVEKPNPNSPYFKGRVTDFLKKQSYNYKNYDVYICGHPHMTQAVTKFLRNNGADRIFW